MAPSAALLPGNLDLVILKAISLGWRRLVDAIARSLIATPQEI